MQHFCAAAAILGANMCENDTPISMIEQSFINHMSLNGLSYGTAEEYEFRLALFTKLDLELNEINANPENTFTVAHNHMSTWTNDEYNMLMGSKKDADNTEETEEIEFKKEVYPSAQNWTSHMMPVQNQGHCGSCWAFSATGTIEGHHHMKTGKHVKLSEQQLVDCYYSRDGCQGGDHTGAQVYVGQYGQTEGAGYPYKAVWAGKCLKKGGAIKTTGSIHKVKNGSYEATIAALQNGPVAISLHASSTSFRNLANGVLNDKACPTSPNHAIIAVGYSNDHYIVRNSWGTSWGAKGYGKILMVKGLGICGIQTHTDWMTTN